MEAVQSEVAEPRAEQITTLGNVPEGVHCEAIDLERQCGTGRFYKMLSKSYATKRKTAMVERPDRKPTYLLQDTIVRIASPEEFAEAGSLEGWPA